MSIGHLYSKSSEIERKWVDKLIAQIDAETDYDDAHEVPLCGGSSTDWSPGHRCVYQDKDIPTSYKQKDGKRVDVKRYLTIHEAIERTLMQPPQEGGLGLGYLEAHAVATAIEVAAVEADGYSYEEYTAFWDGVEKDEDAEGDYPSCPPGLFMEPYKQADKAVTPHMHFGVLGRLKAKANARSR